ISHIASNSSSNVEFVGVANDNSNISFSTLLNTSALLDNIKTNQLSKILLLSENANGFIKPFQSIYSQNVSAFHGATVSGIKNDDLFFLNTRGINEYEAKNIIYKSYLLSAFSSIKNSLVLDEFIKFYWDD
ncbi:MAG: SufD family Fe-S cluster assembly protein, partial [Alphaproteobacteria bacterium]|nr:SufD family Fe-S cluster assembly protein [Alphaproteobacteria bacterium]